MGRQSKRRVMLAVVATITGFGAMTATEARARPPTEASLPIEVIDAVNIARANPQGYADLLRGLKPAYHGNIVQEAGHPAAMTFEGVAAVDDAIRYLDHRQPVPPLQWSEPLARAASRLVLDLGPKGGLGHTGSDGSTMTIRIRAEGVWASAMEEDISLVPRTAAGVVRQLIIDDGVPGRGHRIAIFDSGLVIVGAACGPHATYGWMCVIDFAGGLMPAPGSESRGPPPPPPPPPPP